MLPAAARYVVVGGGVHGLSAAYHLAEAGEDVVLLERRHLGAGASGISGGIVRNYYLSPAVNEIVRQSVEIFELDPEGFGLRQVGYVAAVGEEQATELELIARRHEEIGYASTLSGPEPLRELFPDWRADGVAAVLHERRSGWADPNATLANLAGMARAAGVRVVEGAEVVGFELDDGAVRRSRPPPAASHARSSSSRPDRGRATSGRSSSCRARSTADRCSRT
jgi:glycine/D-amino acid oxidase-like deaminating enzyme